MNNHGLILLVSALLVSGPVAAQPLQGNKATEAEAEVDNAKTLLGAGGPIDRAAAAISGSSVQFDTTEGDAQVTIALTVDLTTQMPQKSLGNDIYRISDQTLVFSGTAPIDEEDQDNRIFSGDSIVNGSKLSVKYTNFSSFITSGKNTDGLRIKARSRCTDLAIDEWSIRNPGNSDAIRRYRQKFAYVRQDLSRHFTVDVRSISIADPGSSLPAFVTSECINRSPEDVIAALEDEELLARFEERAFVNRPSQFWGFEASFAQNGFDVLDRPEFEVAKVNRNSWEVGGYFGLVGPQSRWSLRARAVYGRKHEAAEEGEECRAVVGMTEPECITGPDGLPEKIETGIISVEGRKILPFGQDQRFAIAPQVAYDIEEDDLRFELPVYLSPNKEGQLSGGIKLGYTTKEDDFFVGLFVSTPFSIFFD